jgi:hypothetical protein
MPVGDNNGTPFKIPISPSHGSSSLGGGTTPEITKIEPTPNNSATSTGPASGGQVGMTGGADPMKVVIAATGVGVTMGLTGDGAIGPVGGSGSAPQALIAKDSMGGDSNVNIHSFAEEGTGAAAYELDKRDFSSSDLVRTAYHIDSLDGGWFSHLLSGSFDWNV